MTESRRHIPSSVTAAAPTEPTSSDVVTRRVALQSLAGGLGLVLGAAPADAMQEAHPLAAHVAQRRTPAARAPQPRHAPSFLDAHQFATLGVIAELMVPGSVASESPQYIDEVLAIESPQVRRSFVTALAAFDAAARVGHGTTFVRLTAAQQRALLEAAAVAPPASSPVPAPPPEATMPTTDAPRTIALETPLAVLKTWIAGAHFSSEAGMKELGFTGSVFFQTFPACAHEEGHQ